MQYESLSTVNPCEPPAACGGMITNLPLGGSVVLSKCSNAMQALNLCSAQSQVFTTKKKLKRMTLKGEPCNRFDPLLLSFTQTCAGGCRGTGRRWRHTWGLVYDPWSSCRPPRSAGRSLPSLWRRTEKRKSERKAAAGSHACMCRNWSICVTWNS